MNDDITLQNPTQSQKRINWLEILGMKETGEILIPKNEKRISSGYGEFLYKNNQIFTLTQNTAKRSLVYQIYYRRKEDGTVEKNYYNFYKIEDGDLNVLYDLMDEVVMMQFDYNKQANPQLQLRNIGTNTKRIVGKFYNSETEKIFEIQNTGTRYTTFPDEWYLLFSNLPTSNESYICYYRQQYTIYDTQTGRTSTDYAYIYFLSPVQTEKYIQQELNCPQYTRDEYYTYCQLGYTNYCCDWCCINGNYYLSWCD